MFAAASAANAKRMTVQQREERRFLKDAAATNRFQGDAARMALSKSSDPAVRSLADTFIGNQNGSGNELLRMLHGRGMAPPMLENAQRRTLNRLTKLDGSRFDREFVEQVALKSQQEELQYYENAAATARDPALKAWIGRTLPALREHVATAEGIAPGEEKVIRVSTPPRSAAHPAKARRGRHATMAKVMPEPAVVAAPAAARSMGAGRAAIDASASR